MKKIEYLINHQYQPTNTTCSPTALSMLLNYYGIKKSVNDITTQVPQVTNKKGELSGTINQQLATWCKSLGFEVTLYTFDCLVIDQSWAKLSQPEALKRLEARKDGLPVPGLGKEWTERYTQSYIDLIKSGCSLVIQPFVTSKLMYKLLETGPILPCVSFSTLYGKSRVRNDGVTKTIDDDVNGKAWNHSIVIYGVDENGNLLVADPWEKPGFHVVEPERMIAAISTAQLECDNLLFQLNKS